MAGKRSYYGRPRRSLSPFASGIIRLPVARARACCRWLTVSFPPHLPSSTGRRARQRIRDGSCSPPAPAQSSPAPSARSATSCMVGSDGQCLDRDGNIVDVPSFFIFPPSSVVRTGGTRGSVRTDSRTARPKLSPRCRGRGRYILVTSSVESTSAGLRLTRAPGSAVVVRRPLSLPPRQGRCSCRAPLASVASPRGARRARWFLVACCRFFLSSVLGACRSGTFQLAPDRGLLRRRLEASPPSTGVQAVTCRLWSTSSPRSLQFGPRQGIRANRRVTAPTLAAVILARPDVLYPLPLE